MSSADGYPLEGGCTCRNMRYRMLSGPLSVHCCLSRWCQRETGASFAHNAMIEADRAELLAGHVDIVMTPSNSGKGQKISRCPRCRIAVWSNYAGRGTPCIWWGWARSTFRTVYRPTSTSSPRPSSRGSCCPPPRRQCPSTTIATRTGRTRASSDARCCSRESGSADRSGAARVNLPDTRAADTARGYRRERRSTVPARRDRPPAQGGSNGR